MFVTIARLAILVIGAVLIAYQVWRKNKAGEWGLAVLAVLSMGLLGFFLVNHINFPLHLDVMEGTVYQHFQRASDGLPIYPEPTPAYVPLAYNPLYYVVSVPFGWVFGVNLFTLRLVATLAFIGSIALMFWVIRQETRSNWWGLMGAGLFAAAYAVMDTYLNTAHSDSWFIFTALLGSLVIHRSRTLTGEIVGLLVLVTSFWFKQHGALFVIGGVLYLTWRAYIQHRNLRRALLYWLIAALLGPGLYVFAGRALFGSHFHYFTWEVPRNWSSFDFSAVVRLGGFVFRNYLFLALAGGLYVLWVALRERQTLTIWHVQFVFAVLSALMGALDSASADNVFIALGVWCILVGVLAFYQVSQRFPIIPLAALLFSFILLVYDPVPFVRDPNAGDRYDEFIAMLDDLDGPVYAPWQGQLVEDFTFFPTPHWVALEDMIRGPGRNTTNHPNTRSLLTPAIAPEGDTAYILTNIPLETYNWIAFLGDYYRLEQDFGDRFAALAVVPRRFDHAYPRYLYQWIRST